MRAHRRLDEAITEALLSGRPVTGQEDLEMVTSFVADMRAVAEGPAPPPSAALASVLASGLTTDKGDLLVRAASNVTGPAPQAAGLPKWRRKNMVETLLSSIAAKLAALGVVAKAGIGLSMAAASVGGAAAAGVPVAEHAVEAVTPIELGGSGNDDVAEKIQQVGDEVTTEEDVLDDGNEEVVGEPAGPPADTKGAEVSAVARNTPPGPGHGAAVSAVASEGKSRAGTHGSGGASAPVGTPNGGGTATADQASNGGSTTGTPKANVASGGRAAAGAGNAETGVAQRP